MSVFTGSVVYLEIYFYFRTSAVAEKRTRLCIRRLFWTDGNGLRHWTLRRKTEDELRRTQKGFNEERIRCWRGTRPLFGFVRFDVPRPHHLGKTRRATTSGQQRILDSMHSACTLCLYKDQGHVLLLAIGSFLPFFSPKPRGLFFACGLVPDRFLLSGSWRLVAVTAVRIY